MSGIIVGTSPALLHLALTQPCEDDSVGTPILWMWNGRLPHLPVERLGNMPKLTQLGSKETMI